MPRRGGRRECKSSPEREEMTKEKWGELAARYMTAEQREAVKQMRGALPEDFDGKAQMEKWQELAGRIRAALPLDPASPKAQALLDELLALSQPFVALVPPEMKEGTKSIAENFEQWEGEMPPSFVEVYRFKRAASAARREMRKE